jgi:hypothetical protein
MFLNTNFANINKPFDGVTVKAGVFVSTKLIWPGLIFAGEAKHFSGDPLQGRYQALPTNIRLVWRGMQGTNTLAYYQKSVNYCSKKVL